MSPAPAAHTTRRLAYYALLICALTVVAAVLSFTRGNWLGIIWVLLAGLSSNIAWYYFKKDSARRAA